MSLPINPSIAELRIGGVMALAKLWKIERTDGVTLRFTDFSQPIEFEGSTYLPGTSDIDDASSKHASSTTAFERSSELVEGTMDMSGAFTQLTSDSITHEDLRAGRYDSAKITEYIIDYRVPWFGYYAVNVFWIESLEYDAETFVAELSTRATWLKQNRGREYDRHCPYRLGVNDGAVGCFYTVDNDDITVTAVGAARYRMTCNNADATRDDGWSTGGVLIWATGNNAGIRCEVKLDEQVSGASHEITLQERLPFDIQVGDTATIQPGCDGLTATCDDKFDQFTNFGGFPDLPGDDRQFSTPNSK